jgi:RNA polymerase sigma-70 factor (ECF subfamily)
MQADWFFGNFFSPVCDFFNGHLYMNQEWEKPIIRRVREGDHEAFAIIVETYSRPLYNLMYRMTGHMDDARELAHETFIRAFEQLPLFDENRRFFPWLYAVALNIARNHRRKISSRVKMPDAQTIPATQQPKDPECQLCVRSEEQRLQFVVDRLADREKEAVILRYYQDLSFDEIAEILGISGSAAKMRVYRALKRLRGWLDEEIN